MKRHTRHWLILLLLPVLTGVLVWLPGPASPCSGQSNCAQPTKTGRQPYPTEMMPMFDKAARNQMGAAGPVMTPVNKGYPTWVAAPPYVPCILMYAVAFTESGWKQFDSGWNEFGGTLISPDCGYGVMQITSQMNGSGPFNPSRVTGETQYNIGTGAQELIIKWNNVPFIGENDPSVVEEWYYAAWAYNGWSYLNNPNDSRFDPDRPPFDGSQPRSEYPYQEIVWGFAANPPSINGAPRWVGIPLTLPNRALIGDKPPSHIPRPTPFHTSCPATQPTAAPTATPTFTPIPTATTTFTPLPTATFWPTHPAHTPQVFFPLFEDSASKP